MTTAALVIVGQELLSGKVQDENIHFLTRELFALGVETRRVSIVRDAVDEIAEAVASASAAHDLVFTTGGLGPTHDDVTVLAVAQALGRKLVHSNSLEKLLRLSYGVGEGPELLRLSRIPEGSELYHPEGATYPQLQVGNVYLFPGVPELVRRKFSLLSERFRSDPIHSAVIQLNCPELSVVDALNLAVEQCPAVTFGSYPTYGPEGEHVKLTLDCADASELKRAHELLLELLGERSEASR